EVGVPRRRSRSRPEWRNQKEQQHQTARQLEGRAKEAKRAPPSRASSRAARVACRSHNDLVREHRWGKTYAIDCEEAMAATAITPSESNDQKLLSYAQGSVGVSVGLTMK